MMMKKVKKTGNTSNHLEVLTANMVALQMKAKMFHLNVTGPTFYGDHHTYDGIYAVADEWFDTLAERMRALQMPVCVCPEWVMTHSMLCDDADEGSNARDMLKCMLECLERISAHIQSMDMKVDPTTLNMAQELDAELGKQAYFIRSSL